MSGTRAGGKITTIKVKAKLGKDFYKLIGALGGAASGTGGFYNNPEGAKAAGLRGWEVRKSRASRCSCGKWILNEVTLTRHLNLGHKAKKT